MAGTWGIGIRVRIRAGDRCLAQIGCIVPSTAGGICARHRFPFLSLAQTNPIEPGTPLPPVNWYTGYKSTRLYLVHSPRFVLGTIHQPCTRYTHTHNQKSRTLKKRVQLSLIKSLQRLSSRNQCQFIYVFLIASAGKVVHRGVQSLEDRAYCFEVS